MENEKDTYVVTVSKQCGVYLRKQSQMTVHVDKGSSPELVLITLADWLTQEEPWLKITSSWPDGACLNFRGKKR